ncbi:cobalt-precorrin-6A reductase [Thalassospira lucentensis]|uniref:cobalt-precorrin-6A reductase n=1 Tax=Thalassospira lucentensis TaxID=168935 RepID=UPI00142E56B2|nr:cobalt-precorrin-6A reductase [Thalassospira lucentensis]NIZ00905.1 cobalt-precorrin-6A reductase [Thalassospira lucentensis]
MPRPRSATRPMHVLIFGGTGDANRIIHSLQHEFGQDVRLQLSLAGRTSAPSIPDGIPVRIGGFGGPEGIIAHFKTEKIDLVIDATHPYATAISANIAKACHAVAMPCIQYHRPAWERTDQDNWIMVQSIEEAAAVLPDHGTRALIASGAKNLHAFEGLEKTWLLVRTIDAPRDTFDLAYGEWMFARGPFSADNEIELIERNEIDVIVCKNSGGKATFGKIEAARALNIPVIMIARPGGEPVLQASDTETVVQNVQNFLDEH